MIYSLFIWPDYGVVNMHKARMKESFDVNRNMFFYLINIDNNDVSLKMSINSYFDDFIKYKKIESKKIEDLSFIVKSLFDTRYCKITHGINGIPTDIPVKGINVDNLTHYIKEVISFKSA